LAGIKHDQQELEDHCCFACFDGCCAVAELFGAYRVVRVVDGDTAVIEYFGKQERVRLLCVNTPESVHPDKKQNIPMGKVASNYTAMKLMGKYVELEFGPERRDRYGRLLGYLFLDGMNFNVEVVRNGLSPYYTKFGSSRSYDHDFKEAEKFARKNKLNIWGDPELSQKYLRLKSKWGMEKEERKSTSSLAPSSLSTALKD